MQNAFSGGGASFANEYKIYKSGTCQANPPQSLNCAGVTVISSPSSSNPYALAGAVNNGCFFASLNNTGVPVQTKFYQFPSVGFSPTKPIIIENQGLNQGFFICGSYSVSNLGWRNYILRIDQSGNLLQSAVYGIPFSGGSPSCYVLRGLGLRPTSMLLSTLPNTPSGQSELIIVGEAEYYFAHPCAALPPHSSGYFARLDPNTLLPYSNTIYDYQSGLIGATQQTNYFNSVTQSFVTGQEGYLLGGYSDINPGSRSWMMRVNPSGAIKYYYNIFHKYVFPKSLNFR